MKRIFSLLLITGFIISCAGSEGIRSDSSGTFRGKWWNYYDRGLMYSEQKEWGQAKQEMNQAISMREKDQRMARTYGMHFIDYFPHRELGIVYLGEGKIDEAISELERSLRDEESSKAIFYLNRARKTSLLQKGLKPDPPSISLSSPVRGAAVNGFKIKVTGRVAGEGYIAQISVNGEIYRIGLAEKAVEFEKEITVYEDTDKITVVSEDLLGNVSIHSIPLTVDREGPAISIFDIAREDSGGKETVRITGEVNDSTGIDRLTINNKNVAAGGKSTYEFNVIAEGSTFVLQAFDNLDNVTKAEIDIKKELAAFNRQPAPVMLAFAGPDIFSSDNMPPVINLKDSVDMPVVFVDKYYVEGEVSDNSKVENIIINGRDIFSRKGKKIFFSKLMKLDEGKNDIDVEAFDSSGNRSEADFTVTRSIPKVMQVGSRMSVSILPFETKDQGGGLDVLAYEQLIGSFVEQKRFNIIERTKLEQVLLEQKLTKEKLTDPKYSIQVGRLMAADTVLATSLNETGNSIECIARVINTETSAVMEVKDVYSEDKSASSVKQLMIGLASKVAGSFPLVEGLIIKRDEKFVYTDLGTRNRIKGDTGIIIYRLGEEIKHPLTGKSLGRDMESLGEAEIEEIHEEFSKAKLSDRLTPKNIKVRDMVITR